MFGKLDIGCFRHGILHVVSYRREGNFGVSVTYLIPENSVSSFLCGGRLVVSACISRCTCSDIINTTINLTLTGRWQVVSAAAPVAFLRPEGPGVLYRSNINEPAVSTGSAGEVILEVFKNVFASAYYK